MTWLVPTIAWTLAALALALLAWSLFWDRSRGRKRCPKCWYDMCGATRDGAGAFRCPECGKTVRRDRLLRKTRRRWGTSLLAVLLIGASYSTQVWPHARKRGWIGLIPTTVLIALSPDDDVANLIDVFDRSPLGPLAAEIEARGPLLAPWHVHMLAARARRASPHWDEIRIHSYEWAFRSFRREAMTAAERDRLRSDMFSPLMDLIFASVREREARGVWMGGAWIGAAPDSFHEEFSTVIEAIAAGPEEDFAAPLPYRNGAIGSFDIRDLCPVVLGQPLPNPNKIALTGLIPPGGMEGGYVTPFHWGGGASAELVRESKVSFVFYAGYDPDWNRASYQELPGRLIVWGSGEWIDHVAETIRQKRGRDGNAP